MIILYKCLRIVFNLQDLRIVIRIYCLNCVGVMAHYGPYGHRENLGIRRRRSPVWPVHNWNDIRRRL